MSMLGMGRHKSHESEPEASAAAPSGAEHSSSVYRGSAESYYDDENLGNVSCALVALSLCAGCIELVQAPDYRG